MTDQFTSTTTTFVTQATTLTTGATRILSDYIETLSIRTVSLDQESQELQGTEEETTVVSRPALMTAKWKKRSKVISTISDESLSPRKKEKRRNKHLQNKRAKSDP